MIKDKSQKIHILYLPKWYPNKYDPMPGLFIKRHAMAASKHCQISVLYLHADDQLKRKEASILFQNEDQLSTYRVYYPKSNSQIHPWNLLINTLRFFIYAYKGLKLIKKEQGKVDILHVNVLSRLGFIAWINQIFHKTPYVITEHWTRYLPNVNTYHGFLRKKLSNIIVKNASAVLPVTKNLGDAMQSQGLINSNYQIIPNVVDTKLFHPSKNKEAHLIKKIVHLSCFTDAQKNISGILRTFKKLVNIRDDFELHLIGDGEDFDQMRQLSDAYGLTNKNVIFRGLMEGEELSECIRSADLMILFSHYENLPVVILESFASGIPVISSRVGGIHEHLNEDRGALVEPENEDQFLNTLNQTLDQLNKFNHAEIRDYAVEHFSQKVIGQHLYQVYSSIMKK